MPPRLVQKTFSNHPLSWQWVVILVLLGPVGGHSWGGKAPPNPKCNQIFESIESSRGSLRNGESNKLSQWQTLLQQDQNSGSKEEAAYHLFLALSDLGDRWQLNWLERRSLKTYAKMLEDALPVKSGLRPAIHQFVKPRVRDLPWFFLPILLRSSVEKFIFKRVHIPHLRSSFHKLDPQILAQSLNVNLELVRESLHSISDSELAEAHAPPNMNATRLLRPLAGLMLLGLIGMDPYQMSLQLLRRDFPLATYLDLAEQQLPTKWKNQKITLLYSSVLFSAIDGYKDITPSIPEIKRLKDQAQSFEAVRVEDYAKFIEAFNRRSDSDVMIILAHGQPDEIHLGYSSVLSANMGLIARKLRPMRPGSTIVFISCSVARGVETQPLTADFRWKQLVRVAAPEGYGIFSNQVISAEKLLPQYDSLTSAIAGHIENVYNAGLYNVGMRPLAHLISPLVGDMLNAWPTIEPYFKGEHTKLVLYDAKADTTDTIPIN